MCILLYNICSKCYSGYPRFRERCPFIYEPLEHCPRGTQFKFHSVPENECYLHPRHISLLHLEENENDPVLPLTSSDTGTFSMAATPAPFSADSTANYPTSTPAVFDARTNVMPNHNPDWLHDNRRNDFPEGMRPANLNTQMMPNTWWISNPLHGSGSLAPAGNQQSWNMNRGAASRDPSRRGGSRGKKGSNHTDSQENSQSFFPYAHYSSGTMPRAFNNDQNQARATPQPHANQGRNFGNFSLGLNQTAPEPIYVHNRQVSHTGQTNWRQAPRPFLEPHYLNSEPRVAGINRPIQPTHDIRENTEQLRRSNDAAYYSYGHNTGRTAPSWGGGGGGKDASSGFVIHPNRTRSYSESRPRKTLENQAALFALAEETQTITNTTTGEDSSLEKSSQLTPQRVLIDPGNGSKADDSISSPRTQDTLDQVKSDNQEPGTLNEGCHGVLQPTEEPLIAHILSVIESPKPSGPPELEDLDIEEGETPQRREQVEPLIPSEQASQGSGSEKSTRFGNLIQSINKSPEDTYSEVSMSVRIARLDTPVQTKMSWSDVVAGRRVPSRLPDPCPEQDFVLVSPSSTAPGNGGISDMSDNSIARSPDPATAPTAASPLAYQRVDHASQSPYCDKKFREVSIGGESDEARSSTQDFRPTLIADDAMAADFINDTLPIPHPKNSPEIQLNEAVASSSTSISGGIPVAPKPRLWSQLFKKPGDNPNALKTRLDYNKDEGNWPSLGPSNPKDGGGRERNPSED